MRKRTARDVFDVDRFLADVNTYQRRQNISGKQLIDAAGLVGAGTAYMVLRGVRQPGIVSICSLADVCDLSLDDYRIPVFEEGAS